MSETDYNVLLYEKMKAEQDKYRDWLLAQPPSEILNYAYGYAIRNDIVKRMKDFKLEPKQAKALLKSPCPLEDVYKEYGYRYELYQEEIVDSIATRADEATKREAARESR